MKRVIENPDKEKVKKIRAKIKEHDGHCCCAIIFDDDNVCMCKEFRNQIKQGKFGYCQCGLYQVIEENKK